MEQFYMPPGWFGWAGHRREWGKMQTEFNKTNRLSLSRSLSLKRRLRPTLRLTTSRAETSVIVWEAKGNANGQTRPLPIG